MANTIGQCGEFDSRIEAWSSYTERFENFCLCNQIPEERRTSTLLTVISVKSYTLLKGLCEPAKPSTKTYDELLKILSEHLQPKPSVISERYKFHKDKTKLNLLQSSSRGCKRSLVIVTLKIISKEHYATDLSVESEANICVNVYWRMTIRHLKM
jgi:hypothetical protein